MKVGTVTGAVWATKKCDAFRGVSLMKVALSGGEVVAADLVGAGRGERVVVAFGKAARYCAEQDFVDCAIVGILDEGENRVDQ